MTSEAKFFARGFLMSMMGIVGFLAGMCSQFKETKESAWPAFFVILVAFGFWMIISLCLMLVEVLGDRG